MPYDPKIVQPMREELTQVGVKELRTASDVQSFFGETAGTSLVVVNSVCGCAAAGARPAVRIAMTHSNRPDRIATVFAGQDLEATAEARSHFGDTPPSSPSFALFRDGEMVQFFPRHVIEGRDPHSVATDLGAAFDEHCAKEA